MLLRITAILLPIFLIVTAGYLYGRHHRPEMSAANRLNMDLFLPALVFAAMAGKGFSLRGYETLALGALVVVLARGVLFWPLARWAGVSPKTFTPPMMFNNCGNLGLPLAVLAWGEAALPAAVLVFMVSNMLHFSLGARLVNPRTRLLALWRVPVLVTSVLGIAANVMGLTIWPPLMTAVKLLGDVSVPLMLFSLGVRMTDIGWGDWKIALAGALLCPLSGVLLAWGYAQFVPLAPQSAAMLIVFGALPPAVLNYLFAERFQVEPGRVAAIVTIGNLGAVLSLPLVLYWVL